MKYMGFKEIVHIIKIYYNIADLIKYMGFNELMMIKENLFENLLKYMEIYRGLFKVVLILNKIFLNILVLMKSRVYLKKECKILNGGRGSDPPN